MTLQGQTSVEPMNVEVEDYTIALSNEAIDWVVKLKSGEASQADAAAFADWRAQSAAHETAAKEAELIWHGVGIAGDETIAKEKKQRRARLTRRTLIGGSSLALAGLAAVRSGLVGPRLLADYTTGIGEQRSILLADGTSVLLNAASALSIAFGDDERRVTLVEGQATFTVTPDTARPFVVMADNGDTRAIGTQFDVDIGASEVAVTVLEGKVSVTGPDASAPPVFVGANERVHYSARQRSSAPEAVDAERTTAWRRGKLIFDQRLLGDVINEISRYRRGPILVLNADLRDLPVTGVFNLDDPDSVLRTIEQTLPVRVARLPFVTILR